jgi:quinol monooxygenase YgiN
VSAVVYEVTLHVQAALADQYAHWLHGHVREMLALPGFLDARVARQLEPAPGESEVVWTCSYRLRDQAALDTYLAEHAAAMRADGQERFGNHFRASRRILALVGDY